MAYEKIALLNVQRTEDKVYILSHQVTETLSEQNMLMRSGPVLYEPVPASAHLVE